MEAIITSRQIKKIIVIVAIITMILAITISLGVLSHKEPPLIQSVDFGGEDAELLMRLAKAELGCSQKEDKALLMLTVLNRVWSDRYPNSVEDVILQGAYKSVEDGSYYNAVPDCECKAAIEMIYSGWNESDNAFDYN